MLWPRKPLSRFVSPIAVRLLISQSLSKSKIGRAGLPPGAPAPPFQLQTLDSCTYCSEASKGSVHLVVFSDLACSPCMAMLPNLISLGRRAPEVRVIIISRGDPAENREKYKDLPPSFIVGLQHQWTVSTLFENFITPAAFMVDEQGAVVAPVALGSEAILNTFRAAAIKNLLGPA